MTAATPTQPQQPVSLAKPKEIWNTMPGWGIVTNLIPPELIAARKIRVIRRAMAIALATVLVLAMMAFGWAYLQHGAAARELASAQDRTAELNNSQSKYLGGVKAQASIDSVTKSLALVMATDVDTSTLFADIRAQLPAGMSISRLALTLDKTLGDTAGNGNVAQVLDNQADAHIGTITMSGNASSIPLVSTYVDRLSDVTGVVQPYPASINAAPATPGTASSVAWSITLTVNAKRFTHTYDIAQNGSK